MGPFILGTAGFLLYFIYDINSITLKNRLLHSFFAVGSICVISSAIWMMCDLPHSGISHPAVFAASAAGCVFFAVLLVYTLFFALPFDETYREESKKRNACTEGVYSLCRHPGVLWFAGLYICLWIMSDDFSAGIYFISMIFWNFIYVVFQDVLIFPETFSDYREYKKNTPFLLPDISSVRACLTRRRK